MKLINRILSPIFLLLPTLAFTADNFPRFSADFHDEYSFFEIHDLKIRPQGKMGLSLVDTRWQEETDGKFTKFIEHYSFDFTKIIYNKTIHLRNMQTIGSLPVCRYVYTRVAIEGVRLRLSIYEIEPGTYGRSCIGEANARREFDTKGPDWKEEYIFQIAEDGSLSLPAPKPRQLNSDGIVIETDGYPALLSYRQALKACPAGMRLPTMRELAERMQADGALGVKEVVGENPVPYQDGYTLHDVIKADGSHDRFYFNGRGLRRVDDSPYWSSEKVMINSPWGPESRLGISNQNRLDASFPSSRNGVVCVR